MKINKRAVFTMVMMFTMFLCTHIKAQMEEQEVTSDASPTLGVENVIVSTSTEVDSLIIDPGVWSVYPQDVSRKMEISLMDNYSRKSMANIDVIQKYVLDKPITISYGADSVPPTAVSFKNVPYRESYTVRVRIIGNDGMLESERESKAFAFGDKNLEAIKDIKIVWEYLTYKNKKYSVDEGPLIAKNGEVKTDAVHTIQIKNNNKKDKVTVGGSVTYTKFNSTNPPYIENISEKVIGPDSVGSVLIKPVVFPESGTYVANVKLTYTIGGVSSTQDTEFRYMLGDLIINVINLRESGGNIMFDIVGTDRNTQFDFDSIKDTKEEYIPTKKELTVFASYIGQDGVEVDNSSYKVMFEVGEQKAVTLPIDISSIRSKHKNLTAISLSIKDGDNQLYKNIIPFTLGVDAKDNNTNPWWYLVVLCLILVSGYVFVKKHKINVSRKFLWIMLVLISVVSVFTYVSNINAVGSWGSPFTSSYWKVAGNTTSSTFYSNDPNNTWSETYCRSHGFYKVSLGNITYSIQPSIYSTSPYGDFPYESSIIIKPTTTNNICSNNGSALIFKVESVYGITGYPAGSEHTVQRRVGSSYTYYPMNIQFAPGFYGTAHIKGSYHAVNGVCASYTASIDHFFKVSAPPQIACNCTQRNYVCRNMATGAVTSSQLNSSTCQLRATCSVYLYTNIGSNTTDTAVFEQSVSNAFGFVSYTVPGPLGVVNFPYGVNAPQGSTTTLVTTIRDSYDSSTITTTCSIFNPVVVTTTTTTAPPKTPRIGIFSADYPVVRKGKSCTYRWNVTDMDTCAVLVNSQQVTSSTAATGSVSVFAADGLNQRAVLTCTASSSVISTSTLCQVLPEVLER